MVIVAIIAKRLSLTLAWLGGIWRFCLRHQRVEKEEEGNDTMALCDYGYNYDLLVKLMAWRFGDLILLNR